MQATVCILLGVSASTKPTPRVFHLFGLFLHTGNHVFGHEDENGTPIFSILLGKLRTQQLFECIYQCLAHVRDMYWLHPVLAVTLAQFGQLFGQGIQIGPQVRNEAVNHVYDSTSVTDKQGIFGPIVFFRINKGEYCFGTGNDLKQTVLQKACVYETRNPPQDMRIIKLTVGR